MKIFKINEMYPAYKKVAEFQGEKGAEISFTWASKQRRFMLVFIRRLSRRWMEEKM